MKYVVIHHFRGGWLAQIMERLRSAGCNNVVWLSSGGARAEVRASSLTLLPPPKPPHDAALSTLVP